MENNGEHDLELNKLLIFKLYGSFGHFNQPISNRLRNTYSTIPKPQLLGIIGSLIGLDGYKNKDTIPEYYSILKNLKVFIKHLNLNNHKFMVTYNSFNSFLNNRVDSGLPNVIINEQILLNPNYEIGLLVNENDEIHAKIINNIQKCQSVFPIYLGKNEFFANIKYISLNDYHKVSESNVSCSSIFPFDKLSEETTRNIQLELLPVDFNENFKYIYDLMAIPQKNCLFSMINCDNLIKSNGSIYYVF